MTRRTTKTAVAAAMTMLLTAALASAGVVSGTDGPDTLTGTDKRDRIRTHGGDDTVNALRGRDLVWAGRGHDTVDGGRGRDVLRGWRGNDTLNGGPGNDLIFAQRGVDMVNGGSGADSLWALARRDVSRQSGEPTDTVNGEAGHDSIHVRDGEADKVTCGPGNDRVVADHRDDVANDCERVKRGRPHRRDDDREERGDD
jgi:Ca2+-binding RTX toxin-like protein